jgi:transcriptional regulator with XRE-family HTH domain
MTTEWSSADPAFLAAYGEQVSTAREQLGLDRREFADEAGISYSYLSAIESGQKFPSSSVQTAIAGALGVDPSDLLARANGALSDAPAPEADMERAAMAFEPMRALRHERAEAWSARDLSPDYAERELSISGAAAELNALVAQMTGEDRAILLSMARRLAGNTPRSFNQPRERERLYRSSSGQGLRTEAYLQFWTLYLDELERRGLDWAEGRRPEPRSYFTTPSPIRGASLSASFARNRLLRHELYINRGSREANLELLREFEARRAEFEKAYGEPLDFEDPGRERRAVRIAEYRDGHISRTDRFAEYVDWFIDRGQKMRSALDQVLGDL